MSWLIVTPDRNSKGKRDYTGAFRPEAAAFLKHHGRTETPVRVALDTSPHMRQVQLLGAINDSPPLELIALFTHGLRSRLPQFGWSLSDVSELALMIVMHSVPDVRVVLYACDTAAGTGPGGDGGFADALRDETVRLGALGCQVDAHKTAGHTTRNPYVRRFDASQQGKGGTWLVDPDGPLWRRWVRALRETPLRYDFPLLTQAEIHARL
jgi:hypothetical protein